MKVGQGDLLFMCNQGSIVGHRMQDYKCLCIAVTICATLLVRKFDLSILTPQTSKSWSSPRICCTHVRYTHDPNLVTAGQQVAEVMQI